MPSSIKRSRGSVQAIRENGKSEDRNADQACARVFLFAVSRTVISYSLFSHLTRLARHAVYSVYLRRALCPSASLDLSLRLCAPCRGPLSFGHKQHKTTPLHTLQAGQRALKSSPHTYPTAPIRCSCRCTACVSALRWFALPRLAANAHLLRILGILIAHGPRLLLQCE